MILEKVQEIEQKIHISKHEVHKFLLIFRTLVQTINSNELQEETETDILGRLRGFIIINYKLIS